jgi:ribosomal-protein-alanine N-acetyltransferase
VTFLELKPLTAEQLTAVVELDNLCFGGHWTIEGYRRELASPNSHFLTLCLPEADADFELATGLQCQKAQFLDSELRHPAEQEKNMESQNPTSHQRLIGLGCFWSILEEAHITLLAVHPAYQGLGLGQLLFYALLKLARIQGMERATLEVRVSNQVALSLYQKFGFQEAGRRRRYYQDTGEDALILWRGGLQNPKFDKKLGEWNQQISDRLALKNWHLLQLGSNPLV